MKYADGPTAEGAVYIDAPVAVVWSLVSDIHLVASLSAEVQEVTWLDEGPALGAAFRGRSSHPAVGEWTTTSRIVAYEPPRVFGWAVASSDEPAALWRFELAPFEGGTELCQRARMGPGPSFLSKVIASMPDKEEQIVARRLREWQEGIDANLAALKDLAERRTRD